jgi:hypothetical protein
VQEVDQNAIQIVGLVSSVLTPLIIGGVGYLVQTAKRASEMRLDSLEDSIETCVADTKDCSSSIAGLATRAAVTDTNVVAIKSRVEDLASKTDALVARVSVVETRQSVARGAD